MSILPTTSPETWTLEDIFKFNNGVLTGGIVYNIIQLALALGGGVAIIFFLIAAFQYFTAFGNEEKAQKAKTTIMWTIVGIVVIVLSELIVETLKSLL